MEWEHIKDIPRTVCSLAVICHLVLVRKVHIAPVTCMYINVGPEGHRGDGRLDMYIIFFTPMQPRSTRGILTLSGHVGIEVMSPRPDSELRP